MTDRIGVKEGRVSAAMALLGLDDVPHIKRVVVVPRKITVTAHITDGDGGCVAAGNELAEIQWDIPIIKESL